MVRRADCIFRIPVTSTTRDATSEPEITDEGVARLRARIGVPEPHPHAAALPASRRPTRSATSPSAYGDDNPLWCDPDYGAEDARGAAPIAPPPLVGGDTLIGEDEVTAVAAEHARPDEGRSAARRARVLLAPARASGGRRCGPTGGCSAATRSSACSTSRASSPSGAVHEWTGAGVPRRRRARCCRASTG